MSFTPILPASGLLGYRLLVRTEDAQRQAFERQPEVARDLEYFRETISMVTSAEDLVTDRRLLKVALGAFGLDAEIDKRAFLRTILEEGTEDRDSLANKLVDSRYKEFSAAFGFGDASGARTGLTGFADEIANAYKTRGFEIAVGDQDESLRLALNFRREIADLAQEEKTDTAWLKVLGNEALRAVFDDAFGLGDSFSQLDVDRQLSDLKKLNRRFFGSDSLDVFADGEAVDKLIQRFLVRRSIEDGPSVTTPGYAALSLLGGVGSNGTRNLVLSLLG